MTRHNYKCNECGKTIKVRLESMHDEKPENVKCECGGLATFDWNNLGSKSTIIKDHMKAVSKSGINTNFNKIPRQKQKYR